MDATAFEADLKATGFNDITKKEGLARFQSDPHSHPFAVRGLVLSGEFILSKEGVPTSYLSGETFTLEPNCEHTEAFGPEGSTYIIGRKSSAC